MVEKDGMIRSTDCGFPIEESARIHTESVFSGKQWSLPAKYGVYEGGTLKKCAVLIQNRTM